MGDRPDDALPGGAVASASRPVGWYPVAAERDVGGSAPIAARIVDRAIALWRDADGAVHAVDDRCPHRGTRLSLGQVVLRDGQSRLECPYHGWQFAADGRCRFVPALPGFEPPPSHRVGVHGVRLAHGLLWARLGGTPGEETDDDGVFALPDVGDVPPRVIVCGPYDVQTSAPRVVENFLDMSHFAFVHEGLLGDRGEPGVPAYDVAIDARGAPSVDRHLAFQPRAAAMREAGAWIRYRYRVLTPYAALLHKTASDQGDPADAIALWTCPLSQESTRVWMTLFTADTGSDEHALVDFQDRIFAQDLPILESQRPKRLPLVGGELHSAADRLSAAYRRYLVACGVG